MKRFIFIFVLLLVTMSLVSAEDLFLGVNRKELTLGEMENTKGGIVHCILAFAAIYGAVDIVYTVITGHELSMQAHRFIMRPVYNRFRRFLRRRAKGRPYYYDSRKVKYRFG